MKLKTKILNVDEQNCSKKDCVMILRYYCPKQIEIVTRFLCLAECKDGHTTGEAIYNLIIARLAAAKIDSKYIMAAASDTTNSMVGEHNSVKSRFLKLNKDLFYSKSVCHSSALVASYACRELPRSVEQLLRDIANHFSNSALRNVDLEFY